MGKEEFKIYAHLKLRIPSLRKDENLFFSFLKLRLFLLFRVQ